MNFADHILEQIYMSDLILISGTQESTNRPCYPISLDTIKTTHFVKIAIAKLCFFYHLLVEAALQLHHEQ